jgi:hypothetical protein
MFVLEAVTLTFITTPLVTALYPPERRVIAVQGGASSRNHSRSTESGDGDFDKKPIVSEEYPWRHRFTVVLDKLEHMPCMMALTQLVRFPLFAPASDFSPPMSVTNTSATIMVAAAANTTTSKLSTPKVSINALRLIELSDRTSAVMKSTSSASDALIHTDPLLCIFRMFGQLNGLNAGMGMGAEMAIVPYDDLAWNVAEHARRCGAQMVLVPWLLPSSSPSGAGESNPNPNEKETSTPRIQKEHTHNPFELFFGSGSLGGDKLASQFVRGVFAQCVETDVALFVDPGHFHTHTDQHTHTHSDTSVEEGEQQQHIFLPFFGGPDDRLALEFVVQLCANPKIGATVVKMEKCGVESGAAGSDTDTKADINALAVPHQTVTSVSVVFPI